MVTQNNLNNTVIDNDFSINRATASTSVIASVAHSDNANTSSNAELLAESGGASGGDAFLRLNIPSGQDYCIGIDNTSSDSLVFGDDVNPSTGNNIMNITSAGEITRPLQSAFAAYLATDDPNVTGAGTTARIGLGTALTEIFDQNSDFDTNGTFTAPITGKYHLGLILCAEGVTSAGTRSSVTMATSNVNYLGEQTDFFAQLNSNSGLYSTCASIFTDMDAGDTNTNNFIVSIMAGDTVDIKGLVTGKIKTGTWGYLVL